METIKQIVDLMDDKKAKDIKVLDVKGISPITDYMVLATAETNKHAKTIAEYVNVEMKKKDIYKDHMDGYENGEWIIIDYFDFLVHIFINKTRDYYNLDNLYRDSKEVVIND